jgi:transposase
VGWYDRKICRVRDLSCGDTRIFLELEVRRLDCRNCGKVKRERLDFLADNPHYTKRFAYYVGRRCRSATIKDVATDLRLDWHTVKTLDQQYMQAQLARAGRPGPQVIGIDEIAIRKGHTYRIVVSDLLRGRPIWFGGKDRSEASMREFYVWLGAKKSGRIRLAVMDWDGIAAYCRLENKVSLGFVEGLNNKIRVIQRRAYGLRNEDYLRLKILTCTLPEL